ncbi:hypothetical protein LTR15_011271 [Elasticomyces elasticus]|nr:hypothetical protein LTR15_011271 [Elasticomyces elasticus]
MLTSSHLKHRYGDIKINHLFGLGWHTAELAHVRWHRVAGIALPPADANTFSSAVWPSQPSSGEERRLHLLISHIIGSHSQHFFDRELFAVITALALAHSLPLTSHNNGRTLVGT